MLSTSIREYEGNRGVGSLLPETIFFYRNLYEVAHTSRGGDASAACAGFGFCVSFRFNRLATIVKRHRQRANAVRIIP